MDAFLTDVIRKIRTVRGCENAFIAGGAVRDDKEKNVFNDIDVFIPFSMSDGRSRASLANDIQFSLGSTNFENLRNNRGESYPNDLLKTEVYKTSLLGVSIDVIFVNDTKKGPQKSFINRVLKTFNFGINMIANDGQQEFITEEFEKDFRSRFCTLKNLDSMDDVPKMIMKLNRVCLKLGLIPNLTEVLFLKDQDEKTSKKSNTRSKSPKVVATDEF